MIFGVDVASMLLGGVAAGMVLFIVSVGLSVTMGLMGFVNLAHGVFAMAGGYILTTGMNRYGVPYPLALAAAFALVAAGSVALERLLYSRLYAAGELSQVLFTIGLIFMAVAIARLLFGTMQQPVFLPEYLKGQFGLAGRDFPVFRVFLIVFSALMVATLWFGVERTRWGAMVRAAVDNGPMAQAIGIDTRKLFTFTFALGSGLAGLGGALGAEILTVQPTYPFEHLVYFLIVVSVGGLGSLRGPFFAMQAVAADMVERGTAGSIVNIISIAEHGGQGYLAPYVAAKAGLAGLTRNSAYAHRWDRIRINGLNIGWTESEGESQTQRSFHQADDGWAAEAAKKVPMGKLGQPDEIAEMVVLLLSPRSGVVTGSVIDWDQIVIGGHD